MMQLEMYLDGALIDTTATSHFFQGKKFGEHLKNLITEFAKKHTVLLAASANKPNYILSGVQSCMNHFVPLGHAETPQNSSHSAAITFPPPIDNKTMSPAKEARKADVNTPFKNLNASRTVKAA